MLLIPKTDDLCQTYHGCQVSRNTAWTKYNGLSLSFFGLQSMCSIVSKYNYEMHPVRLDLPDIRNTTSICACGSGKRQRTMELSAAPLAAERGAGDILKTRLYQQSGMKLWHSAFPT